MRVPFQSDYRKLKEFIRPKCPIWLYDYRLWNTILAIPLWIVVIASIYGSIFDEDRDTIIGGLSICVYSIYLLNSIRDILSETKQKPVCYAKLIVLERKKNLILTLPFAMGGYGDLPFVYICVIPVAVIWSLHLFWRNRLLAVERKQTADPAPDESLGETKPQRKKIRGFLVVPVLLLIIYTGRMIRSSFFYISYLGAPKSTEQWRSASEFFSYYTFLTTASIFFSVLGLALLFLILRRKRFVPSVAVIGCIVWLALRFVIEYMGYMVYEDFIEHTFKMHVLGFLVFSGAAWCSYFLLSRRVKETFVS